MSKTHHDSKSESKNETPLDQKILPVPPLLAQHHGHGSHGIFAPMREWLLQERVPPVLLLKGAPGIGKRTLAYFLAQWLVCEKRTLSNESTEPGPCGQCLSCLRAIKGTWVDFLEIRPDDDESESLKIDQFRELKSKVGFGAHEGNYRIILIPNVEHMTVQAANSMLKLLEEPPSGWIFLMTTSDPSLLLPTLVSRCQTLRLKPFRNETLTELLLSSGIASDRAQIASDLSQGSWGKAWDLAQDNAWSRRKALFDFLQNPSGMLNSILDWATLSSHEFNFLVDQMELLIFDLIRWTIDTQSTSADLNSCHSLHYSWMNQDAELALSSHAKNVVKVMGSLEKARHFWLERAERLAHVRQESVAPLNRKILIQDLLIPWLAIPR